MLNKLNSIQINFRSPVLWGIYLSLLFYISIANKTPFYIGDLLGTFGIFLILISALVLMTDYFLKRKGIPRILLPIAIPSSFVVLVYLIGLLQRNNIQDYKNIFLISLSLCYFYLASTVNWKKQTIVVMSFFPTILIALNFPLLLLNISFGKGHFSGFFVKENAFASLIFASFFFIFLLPKKDTLRTLRIILTILGGITLIYFSKSRGIWLASIGTMLTYKAWFFIARNKILYFGYLFMIFGVIISVMYFAGSLLQEISDLEVYNQWVHQYTGGRIDSGRDDIWPVLIDLIRQKLVLGYAPGAYPGDYTSLNLSSHNYYLQVLLQVGLLGFIPLIILFIEIWLLYWNSRFDDITRLCGSFFVGILLHQNFEVSLTQNNLALGLLYWTILGIGISNTIKKSHQSISYRKNNII